jgi:hypothetical protein
MSLKYDIILASRECTRQLFSYPSNNTDFPLFSFHFPVLDTLPVFSFLPNLPIKLCFETTFMFFVMFLLLGNLCCINCFVVLSLSTAVALQKRLTLFSFGEDLFPQKKRSFLCCFTRKLLFEFSRTSPKDILCENV